ncbi:hypothetical protein MXB_3283, partial [Myxobolus squamalis]
MSSSIISEIYKIISIASSLGDGTEKDMINFISNQEQCRRQWEKTEAKLKKITIEDIPLREENKSISVQLELARNQLDIALRKRPNYEKRIQYLEQQLHAIGALLNDSDFSELKGLDRNALIQMTNIVQDELEDEKNDTRNIKKLGRKSLIPSDYDDSSEETMETHLVRAASNVRKPCKRFFPADEIPAKRISTETVDSSEPPIITISPEKISPRKHERCPVAEIQNLRKKSIHDSHNKENSRPSAPFRADHPGFRASPIDKRPENLEKSRLYPEITDINDDANYTLVETYLSKPHNLIKKKEIKPGKCSICKKGIGFQKIFYRCQDCCIKCHEDCKQFVSQMCSVDSDKMDCVKEIEKRGLTEQGLYRVSGICLIWYLYYYYYNKSKINDIHLLTNLLKIYIRDLSEPLITRKYHSIFLACGEKNDLARIYKLIDSLPIANRHTLAFLCIHFRKVARTHENLMDFKGLARILGPTIISHACLNPTNTQMYEDTRLQPILMELLFGISDDYWNVILSNPDTSNTTNKNGISSFFEHDNSKIEVSAKNSPLLGRIDGIHNRRKPNPQYP